MFAPLYRLGAVFLLLAFAPASGDSHLPSPCGPAEPGTGTNCMYLVLAGSSYDGITGNRSLTNAPLTLELELWMDFGEIAITGGGFDIDYDTAQVSSVSWTWAPDMLPSAATNGMEGPNGYERLQFDDFSGSGFGGSTGSLPGFQRVGTLSVTVSSALPMVFSVAQPYDENTFPNCFAPGPLADHPPTCVATNFFDISVAFAQDSDGDGVDDMSDNCIDVANPAQVDADNDGFGNYCDADFDNNCLTNFSDLNYMKSVFGSADPEGDLNSSGLVNFADLNLLKQMFRDPPGPSALASCP